MNIGVLVYPGFDEVDAIGPLEVLANAKRAVLDLEVCTVAEHGEARPVTASHGLTVVPSKSLAETPDLLVVPGGMWVDQDPDLGAFAEYQRGVLPKRIAELHAGGTTIASVCTGAMLLAKSGILDGREATTHAAAKGDLAGEGVSVIDARVVDDGDIVTCGGVTSGIDMALWLVERFWSADAAERVMRAMEIDHRSGVHLGANAGVSA